MQKLNHEFLIIQANLNSLIKKLPSQTKDKAAAILFEILNQAITNPTTSAFSKNTDTPDKAELSPSMLDAGLVASAYADEMSLKEFHLGKKGFAFRDNRIAHVYNAIQQAYLQDYSPSPVRDGSNQGYSIQITANSG